MKDKLRTKRKYLQSTYLKMESYLECLKKLSKLNREKKKANNSILKWTNNMKSRSIKEGMRWHLRTWKVFTVARCQGSENSYHCVRAHRTHTY